MHPLQALLLAVIQGFTEFLPISSSAHLALAPWLLGWEDQGLAFDIALHFGTLLAVLLYFGRDWAQIISHGFGFDFGSSAELRRNRKLLWYLACGTVPVAVAGFLFKDAVETKLRNPFVIGSMLIGVGLLMGVADRLGRRLKTIEEVGFWDALFIGLAQAIAIVPGTSRSGITITAALWKDFDRHTAARFSFLLSTPAIGGAALKALLDLVEQGGVPPGMLAPMIIGVAASGFTGVLVIAFFLQFLRQRSLAFFVYYRVIFGIIIIALAAFFRPPVG